MKRISKILMLAMFVVLGAGVMFACSPQQDSNIYNITISNTLNGIITVNKSQAEEGEEILVTATPENGYTLSILTVDGVAITDNKFTMPSHDVVLNALFSQIHVEEDNEPILYNITISNTLNGIITVNKSQAEEGEEISVTAIASSGYTLSAITVNGVALTGSTFTMPSSDVIINALFSQLQTDGESEVIDLKLGSYICISPLSKDGLSYDTSASYNVFTIKENNRVDIFAYISDDFYHGRVELYDVIYTRNGNFVSANFEGMSFTLQIIDEETLYLDYSENYCYIYRYQEDKEIQAGSYTATIYDNATAALMATLNLTLNEDNTCTMDISFADDSTRSEEGSYKILGNLIALDFGDFIYFAKIDEVNDYGFWVKRNIEYNKTEQTFEEFSIISEDESLFFWICD